MLPMPVQVPPVEADHIVYLPVVINQQGALIEVITDSGKRCDVEHIGNFGPNGAPVMEAKTELCFYDMSRSYISTFGYFGKMELVDSGVGLENLEDEGGDITVILGNQWLAYNRYNYEVRIDSLYGEMCTVRFHHLNKLGKPIFKTDSELCFNQLYMSELIFPATLDTMRWSEAGIGIDQAEQVYASLIVMYDTQYVAFIKLAGE